MNPPHIWDGKGGESGEVAGTGPRGEVSATSGVRVE